MVEVEDAKTTLKEMVVDCLEKQISEYELLKSMYPDQGEIILSDKHVIDEINDYLNNKSGRIPKQLDFKLNLIINDLKLEVFINLPTSYPKDQPDVYVRCNQLNRQNESTLNSELSDYITKNYIGEVCLYTAISWLLENFEKFTVITQTCTSMDKHPGKEDEFARFWIYSHHIYSKKKREEIVKKAKELKLTGFSLPGKPGIICIEGYHNDCKDWWKEIKSMTWKKIVIKETETFKLNDDEASSYKKFSNFEEVNSSMSDLAKRMNELGLSQVFNDLFGLCNED